VTSKRLPSTPRAIAGGPRDEDDAFIALLIAAMAASGHVSAEEAARAHHIIWSTRRFRHRSGEAVGRKIARMREFIKHQGDSSVVRLATRRLTVRLRRAVFAVAADIVLVDGRMERAEGRYLRELAAGLGIEAATAKAIVNVMRIKNSI